MDHGTKTGPRVVDRHGPDGLETGSRVIVHDCAGNVEETASNSLAAHFAARGRVFVAKFRWLPEPLRGRKKVSGLVKSIAHPVASCFEKRPPPPGPASEKRPEKNLKSFFRILQTKNETWGRGAGVGGTKTNRWEILLTNTEHKTVQGAVFYVRKNGSEA